MFQLVYEALSLRRAALNQGAAITAFKLPEHRVSEVARHMTETDPQNRNTFTEAREIILRGELTIGGIRVKVIRSCQ